MIIDPRMIAFHEANDVIDYVSRGFIPKRENYNMVIAKLRNPDSIGSVDAKIGKEVVISEDMADPITANVLADALDRVYENRRRNRNITIGAAVGIGVGCVAIAICCGSGDSKSSTNTNDKK